jgi:hypothetical protein
LPSPEPLKRVVPLDIFPTGLIASSLVQKSYSVNFPGEFGGGVINLTTKAVPKEPFLTISGGISADSETTNQLGYSYYGSKSDWSGFDNGSRDIPPALQTFLDSGDRLSSGNVDSSIIAGQLVRASRAVVQRFKHVQPNFSTSISGGRSWDIGDSTLGLIASAGYSNKWQTRESLQQTSLSADLSTLESSFRQVNTDQRIVVNGLLGLGLEFGDNKIRWTNLYVRDTIKQARIALGNRQQTQVDFMQQRTAWPALAGSKQQTAQLIVEPDHRHVGDRIADPGSGGGQQVVASHQTGQRHPQQGLEAEDRKAAHEHPRRQPPGPLAVAALLAPDPFDRLAQLSSHGPHQPRQG